MTGAQAEQDIPAIVKKMVPGVSKVKLHAAANSFCNDNGKNKKIDRFQYVWSFLCEFVVRWSNFVEYPIYYTAF